MRFSVLCLVLSVATPCGAADSREAAVPNTFASLAECRGTLESGRVRFYEPRYFGLRTQSPVNGRDRVLVPLESDACLEMLVVGGRRFVAQREGTLFRALRSADGSLELYARDDCGNPVYGAVYPAPRVAVAQLLRGEDVGPLPIPPPRVRPRPAPVERWIPPSVPEKDNGFCRSKKCRIAVAVVGASAAGYAAWRLWPCPPGTVRR